MAFGQNADSATLKNTSNTSITFSGLAKNTIYRASIAAVAIDGSQSSAVPDVICRTLPKAPAFKGKENKTWTSVTLYYKSGSIAEGYRIKYTNLKTKKTKTAYTGTASGTLTLKKKTFYKAVISGYVNVGGKKVYGPSTTTYVACQPSLKSKMYGRGVKITWSKVKGAKNYSVYVSNRMSSGYKKKKVTTSTSYILPNMTLWKNYYVYVKANRKVGGKTYSNPTNGYLRVYRYLR